MNDFNKVIFKKKDDFKINNLNLSDVDIAIAETVSHMLVEYVLTGKFIKGIKLLKQFSYSQKYKLSDLKRFIDNFAIRDIENKTIYVKSKNKKKLKKKIYKSYIKTFILKSKTES